MIWRRKRKEAAAVTQDGKQQPPNEEPATSNSGEETTDAAMEEEEEEYDDNDHVSESDAGANDVQEEEQEQPANAVADHEQQQNHQDALLSPEERLARKRQEAMELQKVQETQALGRDSFCKNQRVGYLHKASGRQYEAVVVGVHLDDGIDRPYFTIRYYKSDANPPEMIEKQTTRDRLSHVSFDEAKTSPGSTHASMRGPSQLAAGRLDPPFDHANDGKGPTHNGQHRSHIVVPRSTLGTKVHGYGRNIQNKFGFGHAVVTVQGQLVAGSYVVVIRVGRHQFEIMMPRFVWFGQDVRGFIQRCGGFAKLRTLFARMSPGH
eukprot:scaffold4298_cov183-Amphora_coffeaeformis.AAC.6